MKKPILLTAILCAAAGTAFSADIADIPWGTSSSGVISLMGTTDASSVDRGRLRLGYDIKLDGRDYTAFLYFEDGRLTEKKLCLQPETKAGTEDKYRDLPPLMEKKWSFYKDVPETHPIRHSLSHYVWQMKCR